MVNEAHDWKLLLVYNSDYGKVWQFTKMFHKLKFAFLICPILDKTHTLHSHPALDLALGQTPDLPDPDQGLVL